MRSANDTDTVLERVVLVCARSGYCGEGIFKAMYENCELMRCLLEHPSLMDAFPWFAGCTEEHQIFYENLLSALRPTFPDVGTLPGLPTRTYSWPGRSLEKYLTRFADDGEAYTHLACMQRLLQVCGPEHGVALRRRLDENRRFMEILISNEEKLSSICWIGSWITLNDIFFENLRRALGELAPVAPDYPRPWPGRTYYRELLSFDASEKI
jgi:hypothetical protein